MVREGDCVTVVVILGDWLAVLDALGVCDAVNT